MVDRKGPFTYEKNFNLLVSLRITSQHGLDGVTIDTVKKQVLQSLTHIDTITEVTVQRIEEAPSQLGKLIERLAILQNVLDQIKEELHDRKDDAGPEALHPGRGGDAGQPVP